MILLAIDGLPVPWAAHQGYGKRSFNPRFKEKEYYQWQIRSQWNQEIITGPVHFDFTFHMPIPKGTSKIRKTQMLNNMLHHISRPDIDNLNKFLSDCLKGIVVGDDNQVCKISAEKIYGIFPKTVIRIFPI